MVRGDVGVVEQIGGLPVGGIVRWIGEGVVAVVAVHGLVLVAGVAFALEAEMRLFAEHLAAAGHARGEIHEFGVQGDVVETGARKREAVGHHVHGSPGTAPVVGFGTRGVFAKVHPPGKYLAPLVEGAGQFRLGEEALHDGVAVFAVVLGMGFGNA